MSERQALLEAVLAEPDDDAPRLVFADWLEEYGDLFEQGWAELIRVQIAKVRLIEETPAWRKLDRTDRALRDQYKNGLLLPFRGMAGSGHVIRGFVERLTMQARRFMAEGDRLFTLTPLHTLRFVALTGNNRNEPTFPELLDSPPVGRLRGLDFEGSRPSRAACEAMAGHPHTRQVRFLGLSYADLVDDELASLFPVGSWPSLRRLELARTWFTAAGIRHLAAGAPTGLEELSLSWAFRSPEAVAALAAVDFPALTRLYLSACKLSDAAVAALAQAPFAGRLQVLNLSRVYFSDYIGHPREDSFGDAGLLALVSSGQLDGLRSLNVSGQALSEAGVRSLLAPGLFPRLETLDLRGIPVSKPVQAELRKRYGVGVCRFSPA